MLSTAQKHLNFINTSDCLLKCYSVLILFFITIISTWKFPHNLLHLTLHTTTYPQFNTYITHTHTHIDTSHIKYHIHTLLTLHTIHLQLNPHIICSHCCQILPDLLRTVCFSLIHRWFNCRAQSLLWQQLQGFRIHNQLQGWHTLPRHAAAISNPLGCCNTLDWLSEGMASFCILNVSLFSWPLPHPSDQPTDCFTDSLSLF